MTTLHLFATPLVCESIESVNRFIESSFVLTFQYFPEVEGGLTQWMVIHVHAEDSIVVAAPEAVKQLVDLNNSLEQERRKNL